MIVVRAGVEFDSSNDQRLLEKAQKMSIPSADCVRRLIVDSDPVEARHVNSCRFHSSLHIGNFDRSPLVVSADQRGHASTTRRSMRNLTSYK